MDSGWNCVVGIVSSRFIIRNLIILNIVKT